MDDNETPSGSPPEEITLRTEEEFPLRVDCPQCKRPYRTETLHSRVNTLLTETWLTCPRCRRKLKQMRLKDWYDHYIQGQTPDPVRDEPTFAPKMTGIPKPPPQSQQRPSSGNQPRGFPPVGGQPGPDGRGGGGRRRRRRGRRR